MRVSRRAPAATRRLRYVLALLEGQKDLGPSAPSTLTKAQSDQDHYVTIAPSQLPRPRPHLSDRGIRKHQNQEKKDNSDHTRTTFRHQLPNSAE